MSQSGKAALHYGYCGHFCLESLKSSRLAGLSALTGSRRSDVAGEPCPAVIADASHDFAGLILNVAAGPVAATKFVVRDELPAGSRGFRDATHLLLALRFGAVLTGPGVLAEIGVADRGEAHTELVVLQHLVFGIA